MNPIPVREKEAYGSQTKLKEPYINLNGGKGGIRVSCTKRGRRLPRFPSGPVWATWIPY